ncbi:septum site-determining protein MinC [Sediminicurvatus halobius]|uniref:Probable septum site-determining protein MinC n=1 Tax=Sediminicurvatus halobius TaxID=2182432 RepID=A0A2U2N652_9GAMM|nr:septum site-determining protein MinC [Spiribacter halobius]PWG64600.1 septum site-determining protein MinC [Spiribacter halobius]UEX79077.1 septum site-determining protein MinC [Spiribacter halobius]
MASQLDAAQPAFELKGRMATLTVLRVLTRDPESLLAQLDERLAGAPGFFAGMPLVLEPAGEGESIAGEGLRRVVEGLRERGLVPVASVGLEASEAAAVGLGTLRNLEAGRRPATSEPSTEPPADAAAEPEVAAEAAAGPATAAGAARIVTQPVRSGQQIYARGGDLVVLASVSPGAEVLADGHVHIYGALRGRALAGVQGDARARIFCQTLEAELVAIAGHYQLSEQFEEDLRGRAVGIRLDADALRVEAL